MAFVPRSRFIGPETRTRFNVIHLSTSSHFNNGEGRVRVRQIPKIVYSIYVSYLKRLWKETDKTERERIAADKTLNAVKTVQQLLVEDEYLLLEGLGEKTIVCEKSFARQRMLEACQLFLATLQQQNNTTSSQSLTVVEGETQKDEANLSLSIPSQNFTAKKKPRRSIFFGAVMGAVVACWVFSGNYIFTGLFTLMTILGQLEYYRMVMNTGVYPARKISIVGACSMFLTALFAPELHQITLPAFGTYAMIWFLTMRRKVSTINEIATTFTGMFYLGYVPSFWVRIRLIGSGREPTRLAPIVKPMLDFIGRKSQDLPAFLPKTVHLPITTGAIFIFWTWIAIAFSDVGAYFFGRSFGKTKIAKIAPAAGAASPNKTIEGFLGGTLTCALFTLAGAWVQNWPYFYISGTIHGIMLSFLGLVGDLTASMLKRDAGLKDFGDILPEHGGIMDRVDSFVFTAPYSWLVCQFIVPWIKLHL